MLPWFAEWIAHLSRMSGKSVTAKDVHDAPGLVRRVADQLAADRGPGALREPSQPTTYLARIVEVSPVSLKFLKVLQGDRHRYFDEPLVSIWMSLAWRP